MSQLTPQQKQAMQALLKQQGVKAENLVQSAPEDNRIVPDETNRLEPYPLTDIQQSYLLGRSRHFVLGNVGSHAYLEFSVEALDVARYEHAWDQVVAKHDMLRTIVNENGTQQTLVSVPDFVVTVHDFRHLSDVDTELALLNLRQDLSHQVIDVSQWPLFNIHVSQIDGSRQRIHWSFDAIVSDVHSNFIFQEEIFRCYHDPSVCLTPLSLTFRDYVLALKRQEQGLEYAKARDYWLKKLEDFPPPPSLPLQKDMGEINSPHFSRLQTRLSADKWGTIVRLAQKHGVTPTLVLLTAFSHVLARWGKQQRFTLNLTLFNRQPWHEEMEQLVGDFTSTVLLAVEGLKQSAEKGGIQQGFIQQVKYIQQDFMGDLEHRSFSGMKVLQEWSHQKDGQQLVPVIFTSALTVGDVSEQLDTGTKQLGSMSYSITQTPQVLLDHQVFEDQGELCIHWDHIAEAFYPGVLQSMFEAFKGVLEYLADGEDYWLAPMNVPLPAEQLIDREEYNQTDNSLIAQQAQQLIHQPFLQQVKANPQQVAVVNGDKSFTYLELASRSWSLAQSLTENGLQPGDNVAVIIPKGWQQVVAVLAISAAGGVYVPIDSHSPVARIEQLTREAGCQLAVCSEDENKTLPSGVKAIYVASVCEQPLIAADHAWPATRHWDELAYIIYTSGSTGKPKGVMMSHAGAVNTLLDINQRLNLDTSDAVFGLSALNFDLSVYDIFGTLGAGATLVLPESGNERNPAHWLSVLAQHPCSVWNTVPALMQMLVESMMPGQKLTCLQHIMLSGDKIPLDLPDAIQHKCPQSQLISLGGATEAAIWSIFYPVDQVKSHWKTVPYGRPLANQRFYVLDDQLRFCPDFVSGNLYIGGVGLAKGYWGDSQKTQKHFVKHPHSGEALYFTGDIGCFHPSDDGSPGYIEFQGREDAQIKLGGHRIELGEIEFHLNQHQWVVNSVVDIVEDCQTRATAQRRLVAYIVSEKSVNSEQLINSEQLNQWLGQYLPQYMLPSLYISIEDIPLNANGKVVRKGLPTPDFAANRNDKHQAAESEIETVIHSVVCERLNMSQVSIDDNFFDLGASSLDMVAMHKSLELALKRSLSVLELFEQPNIRALAHYLDGQDHHEPGKLSQAREARTQQRRKRTRRSAIDTTTHTTIHTTSSNKQGESV